MRRRTMSTSARFRQSRTRMWREDPHCRSCGQLTYLPGNARAQFHLDPTLSMELQLKALGVLGQMATIDHLYTRFDPRRPAPTANERRWRLLCYACNNRLGHEAELAVPIEERRRRSGRFPRVAGGAAMA